MKLLLTMNLPYTRVHGGTNRSNRALCEGLAARGHAVRVVVPALATPSSMTYAQFLEQLTADRIPFQEAEGIARFQLQGVEVHAVAAPPRLRRYLIDQLQTFAPDWALVSAEDPSQSLLEAALQSLPERIIYLAHTPQMFPFGPASLHPGPARTALVARSRAIVAISRYVAEYIQTWLGRTAFVHHPPHYGAGPFPMLGRFDSGAVLLMNACAVKGLPVLLGLAKALPDVPFAVLPGYGTTVADRAAVQALPNVAVWQNHADLNVILERTRVLLMPSLWVEGFGMAAVDAMLRGVPVMASALGGLPEAKLGTEFVLPVQPITEYTDQLGDNWLPVPVVPEQEIGPWREALERLLTNRALYELQAEAAQTAAHRFIAGLGVASFESFLMDLAADPASGQVSGKSSAAAPMDANGSRKAARLPEQVANLTPEQRELLMRRLQQRATVQEPKAPEPVPASPVARAEETPPPPASPQKAVRLPEQVANLTPEQRELLMRRLQKRATVQQHKGPELVRLSPAARPEELPLSFAQQRLWFLDQLAPNSPHYNLFDAVRIVGSLNIAALKRALHAIFLRHEVLRTTYTSGDGRPIQVIAPADSFDAAEGTLLRLIDLRALPADEHVSTAQRLAVEEASRPFDLACGPLVRVALLQLGQHEHILFLTMHHIVSDGWSMNILVREIIGGYTAFSSGREPALPPLSIQYADYALWQRQWLDGAVREQQLRYWQTQLAALSTLELPTDYPRSPVQHFRGARQRVMLARPLSDALLNLSRRSETTLFMTLLAAFQILLYRYSNQDDIAVGSPIAGRTQAELEGLIGFFVNTLVLRTSLAGNPSFSAVLQRVRAACLDAYAHQDLPFELLVEALQPARDLSRHPLFQVMFQLQNTPPLALRHAELLFEPLSFESGMTKFDLSLSLAETPDGLVGGFEYRSDLFADTTITRMIGHFQTLLESIVADPDRRVSALPVLPPDELQQVLVDWNATTRPFPPACIHTRFETQADRMPDAVALVFEDQRLTYGALNRRATQLAHELRRRGAGPNIPVGICIDRSLDMIVGLLGILKAGGAYLPLDPAFPPERLVFMLHDAGAPLLLTHRSLAAAIPCTGVDIIYLDEAWSTITREPAATPIRSPSPDQLVYVMYTSGSTGRPKGVAVEHRQLDNYVNAILDCLALPPTTSFATVSTIAADLGNTGIYAALCGGGCLHIIAHDRLADPVLLADYFRRQPIDCLKIVPSHLSVLLAAPHPARILPRLRLILGGEASSWELVAQVQALAPDCRVLNHYGPTETTVGVLTYAVEPDRAQPLTSMLPLGRPLANITIYLLDPNGQPTPLGVPGEVYVGGAGVARGYLHRPELTAERFVPNPFPTTDDRRPLRHGSGQATTDEGKSGDAGGGRWSVVGGRLYRTGDLARYLPDGSIEFLGRIDGQVKLRGYRVELSEIATVLRSHPSVREALVTVREDQPGGKRLVAYVVPRIEDRGLKIEDSQVGADTALSSILYSLSSELREFLKERLPEYMIPSAFVVLQALPLTPNGKLDRAALPALDRQPAAELAPLALPRTPTETAITEIWAALLGRRHVNIHDNFFTLGGHSLLATQVITRVRQLFSIELPLRALFEAPTVADLSERVRLAQHVAPIPAIAPAATDQPLPLSFAQERLWFIQQLIPSSPAYNLPYYLRIQGSLALDALEWSLNQILQRHTILRTAFPAIEGQPFQVVVAPEPLDLRVHDLPHDAEAVGQEAVGLLALAEASRPFQLDRAPLLRALLIRLSDREHVLLVTMHHIVSDAWSRSVLVSELVQLYSAFVAGQPMPLPKLPIQYADYAVWQRHWLQGTVLEQQLAYWKQQLADAPAFLELPFDRPRAPVASFRGDSHAFLLSRTLSDALAGLSHRTNATLFMTLLAAFQTMLYRYSGQDDMLVGAPIAGRTRPETEQLIGCFINMLVLRGDLHGNPSFRGLLGRVREVTLGAYAHQDLPFEALVEALQPARDLSRPPLFQVMFVLQNAPATVLELPGLTLTPLPVVQRTAKFDLTLTLIETPEGLGGEFEYRSDLFDAATIARLAGHFETLLADIVADPDRRLSDLSLLSTGEQQQILVDWNRTHISYPQERCLHEWFAEQVARTPDTVAVVDAEQSLTYAVLNARANQLAHYLQSLQVGPETLVGVCLDRSAALVVTLLGILKAGAAYLPLDPAYPADRLAFMIADAQVPVVITQDRFCTFLAELVGSSAPTAPMPRVLCVDSGWEEIGQESVTHPSSTVTVQNAAYVIYTSGSTGRPKGVLISHRAIGNHMRWMLETFPLTAADRVLQKTPISFDASVWEFYAPLLAGAQLIMAEPGGHQDSGYLVRAIIEQQVSILQLVPSMLRMLLEEPGFGTCCGLRRIFCGGEALPADLVEQCTRLLPTELCNLYGPTETSIDATYWICGAADACHTPPIGRPIANMQVYILDAALQPVPIGVTGELYLGGLGLARGYLGRPELTAERFVPNPFLKSEGLSLKDEGSDFILHPSDFRLYKTGDLARYRSDGTIEYLGRIDGQVKLRGFRIELEEIAAVLRSHRAVQAAVVTLREDRPGQQQLVAYIVQGPGARGQRSGEQAPDTLIPDPRALIPELRAYLKQKLPDYMLPSAFVLLEALPLTPNGKLDRRALPLPARDGTAGAKLAPPRTAAEELLSAIWSEVLGQPLVGAEDNFFELGGHSLLATRVLARVRGTFGVELPLHTLFEAPTIAELAAELERLRHSEATGAQPPLQVVARTEPLPLSFSQQRLWLLDQLAPNNPAYNIASAFQLGGRVDEEALRQSVLMLVHRHEILRTTFALVDDQPVQVIHQDLPPELEVVDLRDQDDDTRAAEVARRTAGEAQRPFDLARGPLLRLLLLRLADDDHVLLLTIHHIVFDGWSLGVLVEELAALYSFYINALPIQSAQQSTPLPALPIQYADYAAWQRQWLRGEVLERQLAYWRAQLAGVPAALELPTDHARPAVQGTRGARHAVELDPEMTAALVALSRREHVTLFMTLLAAFQVLLSRYSGQEDICVGTPIAGRSHPAAEPLIGCFVNTLVLRADLAGDPAFRAILEQVREVALGAYAHQELPFEYLVEALQPERNLSRTPLFQVMFALQNFPHPQVTLADVRLLPLDDAGGTAKFDLMLVLWEAGAGLAGNIEYNCDLFEAATIARLAGHFQILLEGIIADPDRRISALPLLPAEEQHQVLVEWNRTHAGYPQERCLHEWLAEQVARTPDAVAVVDSEQSLTYAALNGRANQLAHHLQALHVGPETLVGICLERSVALVVAMLGILKAGGAYLPLDPNYPADRLRFMLEDAQVSVLLTSKEIRERRLEIGDQPQASISNLQSPRTEQSPISNLQSQVVHLDADWPTVARQLATNPISAVRPNNLAYVLYTSGSTGRPKGVAITQRSVLALLSWSAQLFPAADLAGMLAATSISFDLSVYELFLPLLVGGTVFLAENVLHLLTLPARHAITLVNSVPSAVSELLRLGDLPASVRTLNLAGEPLLRALAEQLYAEPGLRHLYNLYGPTEDTTYSTWALVARDDAREPGIGRPISNTVAYILDGALQPVPIGVAGELYLGGAGLARGYLGRPDLTAERFIPNPFGRLEIRDWRLETEERPISNLQSPISSRLYRTGDLARYRADGQIEYLGRIDQQVKLRGFRIELGEIVMVLRMHPSVREAVAIVREDTPGDRRLVAYIVPRREDRGLKIEDSNESANQELSSIRYPLSSELREFLKQHLPDYMLPSAFVQLDALPLTPNGKLDRRALPGPEPERMIASRLIPPRDMLEFQLVQIWEEILNVHPVGINDRFFELGGHSLLAVQLMSRVRQLVGVSLPLTTLFRHNTVEQLALALRQETAPATSTTLVGIRTGGSKRPFFCFHPLGGNVLCYTHLARHLGSEQPVYGLQSVGLEDDQTPLTQIAAMAAHYVEAIRTVQPEGPYMLGGWSAGGVIAVEVAQRLRAQGQTVALLALLDSYAPVSPERPPPDDVQMLADLAQQFELELDDAALIGLEPDQRLAYVLEQAERLNLALLGNDLARIQRLFDVYKANASALHSYVPRPYHGHMMLFRAGDGPGRPDPTLGWNELAVDGVELHVVPGGHYTMLREPDVRSLAEQLRHAIAQIQTPSEEVHHG